eukprot:SAG25_NODE_647_length_6214_cov_5.107277_2_plen_112_part_00
MCVFGGGGALRLRWGARLKGAPRQSLQPHVYELANNAFKNMQANKQDQSVVIRSEHEEMCAPAQCSVFWQLSVPPCHAVVSLAPARPRRQNSHCSTWLRLRGVRAQGILGR